LGDFQQGFSIKWPTERVQDLYEYLKSLPVDLVSEMPWIAAWIRSCMAQIPQWIAMELGISLNFMTYLQ
jgi:hypothetical protein